MALSGQPDITFLQQLDWVRRHMPRTRAVLADIRLRPGSRIAVCTHLDIKMVPLFEAFLEAGAELFLTTCDPNTVRNDVVAYLTDKGASACAWHGMSEQEWQQSLSTALDWQPDYITEFGGELISRAVSPEYAGSLKAAMEGTGSGVARLAEADLPFPVLNWDDLDAKEGLHNRHMVGLTAWQAFFQRTYLTLHEKNVMVIGYGQVGQGVAASARAYGGTVTVIEKDPARRVMAAYDGWRVSDSFEALQDADVVVTATGARGLIGRAELECLRSGAFVMNVGHGVGEIDLSGLDRESATEVMPSVFEYKLGGGSVFLLADGAMFNLTAGFGDSLNAFDVTLSIMAAGMLFMTGHSHELQKGLQVLPAEVWKPALLLQS